MRMFLGILVSLIILTGAILTVLALWNIQPISWDIIWRSGVTIAIIFATALVLWLIRILFFKKDPLNLNGGHKN